MDGMSDFEIADAVLPNFENLTSRDEAAGRLNSIAKLFDIKNVSYLATQMPEVNPQDIYFVTTYSREWISRYVDRGYHVIDPVVALTRKRLLPLDWSEISPETDHVRRFLGEAREFGVGKQGVSIPIRGPYRDTALFSVTLDCDMAEWAERRKRIVPHVHILAYEFHKSIVELEARVEETGPCILSPREREILQWASEGKTIWETSVILGIAERTVNFHMMGAISRLNCVNKTHAVAKAVRMGLI